MKLVMFEKQIDGLAKKIKSLDLQIKAAELKREEIKESLKKLLRERGKIETKKYYVKLETIKSSRINKDKIPSDILKQVTEEFTYERLQIKEK